MKKFLIKASAGLFVLSLLIAPAIVHSAELDPKDTCRVRSTISRDQLESLTGKVVTELEIVAGQELPGSFSDPIKKNFGIICAFSFIDWATNIAFLLISALSILVIVYAAFLYLTGASGGEADKTSKGKAYLTAAVIGLIVAALAKVIPSIIINFLG